MTEIADEHFGSWVRYHKSFEKYQSIKVTPRTQCEVHVMIGPPGIGKTTKAVSMRKSCYVHTAGSFWFPDYQMEECLVFDEFMYTNFPYEFLLSVCDPLKTPALQIKGANAKCTSTCVVFTSNNSPRLWYPNNNLNAFIRRVRTWWVFDPNLREPAQYADFEAFLLHLNRVDCNKIYKRNAGDP